MTRETKVGLVVAVSFLSLVGVVVAARMKRGAEAAPTTASPQVITPKNAFAAASPACARLSARMSKTTALITRAPPTSARSEGISPNPK